MTNGSFDLQARARRAMIQAGFKPDFPPEVRAETAAAQGAPAAKPEASAQDLRSLLWSSIDNKESLDLDQIEYVEKLPGGTIRLLVGIADVDGMVPKGSATDKHAAANSTTVYTGIAIFPMLPMELSTGLTSLLGDCDRLTMVIEVHLKDSGEAVCHDVFRAWTRNRAKLAYGSTGAWLEGRGPMPPAIAKVAGMEAQIRLQLETAQKLRALRKRQGALTFGSIEARPVIENGQVKDLVVSQHNVAEDIIESFMVAANVAMAQRLKEAGLPCLRRVVKTPERWDRIVAVAGQHGTTLPVTPDAKALADFLDQQLRTDPDHFPDLSLTIVKLLGAGEYIVETPGQEKQGHFGLAVADYTHSTAPNRRYADLVTQRMLKACCVGGGGAMSCAVGNASAESAISSVSTPHPGPLPVEGRGDLSNEQRSIPGKVGVSSANPDVIKGNKPSASSPQPSPPLGEEWGRDAEGVRSSSAYTEAELSEIAAHCTDRESAARKVERLMRKVAACALLQARIGEVFDGMITGASPKGTFVRLLKLPAEGMVVRGAQGLEVGDKVKVQLLRVDMERGFIDFARQGGH